jgi:hypothetical protein
MYLHEAMQQPDKKQFLKAMLEEVTSQTRRKHWVIIPKSEVPEGDDVLPAVWEMKRK